MINYVKKQLCNIMQWKTIEDRLYRYQKYDNCQNLEFHGENSVATDGYSSFHLEFLHYYSH